MQIAPFSSSVCLYPQRRVPCDQFYPDMIHYPYNKLIILLQTIDGKVCTSYIGCETIELVPGSHTFRHTSHSNACAKFQFNFYASLSLSLSQLEFCVMRLHRISNSNVYVIHLNTNPHHENNTNPQFLKEINRCLDVVRISRFEAFLYSLKNLQ